jgi:hypothetical protein
MITAMKFQSLTAAIMHAFRFTARATLPATCLGSTGGCVGLIARKTACGVGGIRLGLSVAMIDFEVMFFGLKW